MSMGEVRILSIFSPIATLERMKIDPRAIRLSLGLTQRAFAERYRIPLRTVQRWELPNARPINLYATLLLSLIQRDPERIARLLKDVA
jgi:putative transcriptional regulator